MTKFKLNMQILYDSLQESFSRLTFSPDGDFACLEDVRIYCSGQPLLKKYVYLIDGAKLNADIFLSAVKENAGFIISGKADIDQIPGGCPFIIAEDSDDSTKLLSLIQDIFEKFREWNMKLHLALDSRSPLDNMLNASLPVFNNPIFIHDPSFYILSCPHTAPGLSVWNKDPRTGMEIAPLSLIQDFKADTEYLNTLNTHMPSLYSANVRGYPILYENIWNHNHYEGRLCVAELESPILPGHYLAIEYLGQVILSCIQNKSLFRFGMENEVSQFFQEYLNGSMKDQQRIRKFLYFLNWNPKDRYLCLRLEAVQQNARMYSSIATLSHIEAQIPDGYAFFYQNGITVIVNLSYSDTRIPDLLSNLAIVLREGLLKMGVSSELWGFSWLPQGYLQAKEALELGNHSSSMYWYHLFDDYRLEYLMKKAGESLPCELLCSHKLLLLKRYDEKNNTDLYHTLKIFLELERNVLKTSKMLFIHRSTLFYRLERIQKIADVNLDDAKERLTLQISFYIMENNSANSPGK